jgi:hypothetical protein
MARLGAVINLSVLLKSTKVIPINKPIYLLKPRFLINYAFSKELCVIKKYGQMYEAIWYPTKNPAFAITWSDLTMTYSYNNCEVRINNNGQITVRTPTYIIVNVFETIYRSQTPVEKHYNKYKDLLLENTDITNIVFVIFRIDYLFRINN